MPRKNPVPRRETEIAHRLHKAREELGYSRTALARQLGFDSTKLVTYELGRVPFPYVVAAKIAGAADLCQRWVATGKLPRKPYIEIAEETELLIPPKMHFSTVYDRLLAPEILSTLESVARGEQMPMEQLTTEPFTFMPPILLPPADGERRAVQDLIDFAVQRAAILPQRLLSRFAREVNRLLASYTKKYSPQIERQQKTGATEMQRHREAWAAFCKAKLAGEFPSEPEK